MDLVLECLHRKCYEQTTVARGSGAKRQRKKFRFTSLYMDVEITIANAPECMEPPEVRTSLAMDVGIMSS